MQIPLAERKPLASMQEEVTCEVQGKHGEATFRGVFLREQPGGREGGRKGKGRGSGACNDPATRFPSLLPVHLGGQPKPLIPTPAPWGQLPECLISRRGCWRLALALPREPLPAPPRAASPSNKKTALQRLQETQEPFFFWEGRTPK